MSASGEWVTSNTECALCALTGAVSTTLYHAELHLEWNSWKRLNSSSSHRFVQVDFYKHANLLQR